MPEIVSTIQKQRSHCEILQTPKSAEGNLKKYNYYVGWERFFHDLIMCDQYFRLLQMYDVSPVSKRKIHSREFYK